MFIGNLKETVQLGRDFARGLSSFSSEEIEKIKGYHSNEIKKILNDHYDEKNIWFYRWRIFFLTCEEFFKINKGKEWFVTHYLLTKKNT